LLLRLQVEQLFTIIRVWDHPLQFCGTAVEWCLQAVLDDLPERRVIHRKAGCGASGRSFNSGDPARARNGTAASYRHDVFLTFSVPESFNWDKEEEDVVDIEVELEWGGA